MKQRVFVYGTLKKGFPLHSRLEKGTYICNGSLEGYEMFAVASGGYPAIKKGEGTIHGELYEVDDRTLISLDMVEGEGYLFKRECVTVEKEDGQEAQAWVYAYLHPVDEVYIRIPSGEWKAGGPNV